MEEPSASVLNHWDIVAVVAYFVVILGVGLYVSGEFLRRQASSTLRPFLYRPCAGPIETPSADSFWPDVICGGCP